VIYIIKLGDMMKITRSQLRRLILKESSLNELNLTKLKVRVKNMCHGIHPLLSVDTEDLDKKTVLKEVEDLILHLQAFRDKLGE